MRTFVSFLIVSLALHAVAVAGTVHVYVDGTGDFPTIQAALNGSTFGDSIVVHPGTYYERLAMRAGRILVSASGPEETIIDGEQQPRVVTAEGLHEPTCIDGFTIQNGRGGHGAGIACFSCGFTIQNCVIRFNTTQNGYGGGIYATECSPDMVFRRNVIYRNYAYIGGGICCNGDDRSTIEGNTIVENDAYHAAGIITYNNSAITIHANAIALNDGPSGYGIYIHSSSTAYITCNDVWQNTPANYHGTDMTGTDGNFSADPIFCDVAQDDYHVADTSPCLPGNHPDGANCGLIGALPNGCGGPTPVKEATWGAIRASFR